MLNMGKIRVAGALGPVKMWGPFSSDKKILLLNERLVPPPPNLRALTIEFQKILSFCGKIN